MVARADPKEALRATRYSRLCGRAPLVGIVGPMRHGERRWRVVGDGVGGAWVWWRGLIRKRPCRPRDKAALAGGVPSAGIVGPMRNHMGRWGCLVRLVLVRLVLVSGGGSGGAGGAGRAVRVGWCGTIREVRGRSCGLGGAGWIVRVGRCWSGGAGWVARGMPGSVRREVLGR